LLVITTPIRVDGGHLTIVYFGMSNALNGRRNVNNKNKRGEKRKDNMQIDRMFLIKTPGLFYLAILPNKTQRGVIKYLGV
jgi:hypothetical protein